MKIGIFNWRCPKHPQAGGAELYLFEQARRWVLKGHKVIWFCGRVPGMGPRETLEGIDFIRCGGKFSVYFWAPFVYFYNMRGVDRIVDAENGIPFFTPLFSKKRKILLIHHIHKNVWFREFRAPISWMGFFLETKVMPLIYKHIPVLTVSKSSAGEILKILPRNKISIVYNAFSKSYIPGTKSKKPSILFVGRLKKYKSVDTLLTAVAKYDKNLEVNIVGRGDDENRLKKIAKTLGLKNIYFHGFVSEKKKVHLLQKSWIFINPSFVEGWSITNIEANACGTMAIGSNVEGIRDSIQENKTGLLFKYGDDRELSKKIKRIIEDIPLRKCFEKRAIKWARNFSWKRSSEKSLKILEDL